tara:strand:+ start:713 stop:1105 length:393 start_codon:yes stop_codon:yes gene_type:complete
MSNSPFSRRGKNSRRRMNAKISKLENQVQAIQTRQDGGPVGGAAYGGTNVLGPEDDMSTPGLYSNQGINNAMAAAGSIVPELDNMPELLPSTPTVASPFTPGAAAAGNNMFGTQVPGSFDRDMGDDMEVL